MADSNWPSEDEDFDAVSPGDLVTQQAQAELANEPSEKAANPRRVTVSGAEPDSEFAAETDEPEAAAGPDEDKPKGQIRQDQAPKEVEDSEPEAPATQPEPATIAESPVQAPVKASSTSSEIPITPDSSTPIATPRAKFGRLGLEAILVLAIIGLGLWSLTLHHTNAALKQQVSQLNANPQITVQKQTQTIIDSVGALMQLPSGETPTIASVSDVAKARQQSAFFTNAQNGDKVLMYVKSGEAILYRPSTNKIVLVAPLTFTGGAASSASPASPSK